MEVTNRNYRVIRRDFNIEKARYSLSTIFCTRRTHVLLGGHSVRSSTGSDTRSS